MNCPKARFFIPIGTKTDPDRPLLFDTCLEMMLEFLLVL